VGPEVRLLTVLATLLTVPAGPVEVLGTPGAVPGEAAEVVGRPGMLPPAVLGTVPNTLATDLTAGVWSIALPTDWGAWFTTCWTGATALVTVEVGTVEAHAPEIAALVPAGRPAGRLLEPWTAAERECRAERRSVDAERPRTPANRSMPLAGRI
jgi:hypothetical protein